MQAASANELCATDIHNFTRKDISDQNIKKDCMAHYRCVPLASLTFRRILGYKLILFSVVTTLIVFTFHEYVEPNYGFLMKIAALDHIYNGSFIFSHAQNKSSKTGLRGEKRAPSVIIFGVSKCGTRAMLEYLKLHPNVVAASTEIDFFNNDNLYSKGHPWYLQQMPFSREGQITVEKSPDYFQNPDCAFRISLFNKDVKLLLLLRDPVERLISQYMQLLDKNPRLPLFEDWAINPKTGLVNVNVPSVLVSAYAAHLEKWLDIFPIDQIIVVESGSLRKNPFQEMKRVESFLNLPSFYEPSDFYFNSTRGFYCLRYRSTEKTKCLGKSKGRQHIPVDHQVKQILRDFYEPYNNQLNGILGYKFEWS